MDFKLFSISLLSFIILFCIYIINPVKCSSRETPTIFTCCKYQSILNPLTGNCEGIPSYEFDYDLFQPEWTIPVVLLEEKWEKKSIHLVERPPWCECRAVKSIPISLRRSFKDANDTGEWILVNDNQKTYLTKGHEQSLFTGESYINRDQFCLNSLVEIRHHANPLLDALTLEFVVCYDTCITTLVEEMESANSLFASSSQKIVLTKTDWERTAFCEDLEEAVEKVKVEYDDDDKGTIPLCNKWTPFYYKDDHFFLILSSQNKTTAIPDRTYPWAALPPTTFCKVKVKANSENSGENNNENNNGESESESEGKLLKFCLPEIKKLFHTKQELYAILAGVSAIFLLLNLSIYFSLRANLSISGWTEFLYSLSLYAYFVFSIVGILIVPESEDVGVRCFVIGILVHYFELANGATLVALSFDIFWTFCKYNSDRYTDDPKVSKMRLILYILFSLFFPMSIVAFGILENQRLSITTEHFGGTPQYGLFHCISPVWPLSSYIQFTMQGLNLLLVLISAYVILNKKNRSPRVFKFDEDDEHHILDPDRLDIFSKLLLFVFIYWLVNFMEFFYQGEIFSDAWHLVAFHIVNYSQGIFAFFILICNRRTLKGLVKREWNLKSLFRHACCTCARGKSDGDDVEIPEESVPLSPLMKKMKTGSIRRSTVRGNAFY